MRDAPLTQKRLLELVTYDQESGDFMSRVSRGNAAPAGKRLGFLVKGYVSFAVDYRTYRAHRLAWLYVYGEFPDGMVDHINGVRTDNRIANLRLADSRVNQENLRTSKANNKLGVLGVHQMKSGKFRACIQTNRKQVHIGVYESLEHARAAYLETKRRLHGGCTI